MTHFFVLFAEVFVAFLIIFALSIKTDPLGMLGDIDPVNAEASDSSFVL